MHAVQNRQSLMTRIVESERRAALAHVDRRRPRRPQPSFVERYRGSEFEGPRTAVLATRAPLLSRGRAFVLMSGAAAMGLLGLIASSTLSA